MVVTIFVTTLMAAWIWPQLLELVSPAADQIVPVSSLLGTGVRLTVLGGLISLVAVQIGLRQSRN